jgi:hypothetical protein
MSENLPATNEENINPLSMINNSIESDNSEETKALTEGIQQSWIPSLGICYALSKTCAQGIARPGEFVLAGQTSLGSEVELISFDFRNHAMKVFENKDVRGNVYHSSSDKRNLEADEEYQKFIHTPCVKGEKILNGVDLFVYVPAQNAFATMYLKGSTHKYAVKIHEASRGGRVVKLQTEHVEYKGKQWYNLKVLPTNRCLQGSNLEIPGMTLEKTIQVPNAAFNENYKVFKFPPSEVLEDDEGGVERDR